MLFSVKMSAEGSAEEPMAMPLLLPMTVNDLDAAADDPSQRHLYLAAAASLSGWWNQQPNDGFFD